MLPLDGRSIKPLLMKGGKGWEARTLLSNWRSRVSIRTDRYRATQQGLYDLVVDPGQLTNLAQTKKEVHAEESKGYSLTVGMTRETTVQTGWQRGPKTSRIIRRAKSVNRPFATRNLRCDNSGR